MLVNDNNRQYYLRTMAQHYGKDINELEERVKKDPNILEGWAEHLANDFEDTPNYRKHYRSTYYE